MLCFVLISYTHINAHDIQQAENQTHNAVYISPGFGLEISKEHKYCVISADTGFSRSIYNTVAVKAEFSFDKVFIDEIYNRKNNFYFRGFATGFSYYVSGFSETSFFISLDNYWQYQNNTFQSIILYNHYGLRSMIQHYFIDIGFSIGYRYYFASEYKKISNNRYLYGIFITTGIVF